MLRFGDVAEADYDKARYRVYYPDDRVTSFWFPHIAFSVDTVRPHTPIAVGTQVAVLESEDRCQGVILGAVYSDAEPPRTGLGPGETSVAFGDSAQLRYVGGVLTAESAGNVIEVGPGGVRVANAADNLASILNDLITALTLMTHLSAAPGAPTSPPVNLAAFTAIQTRLNALLTP